MRVHSVIHPGFEDPRYIQPRAFTLARSLYTHICRLDAFKLRALEVAPGAKCALGPRVQVLSSIAHYYQMPLDIKISY